MRTFRVSDQVYEQLKSFIVDPFDDTPEIVIGRLIEIVNKAKGRWAAFEVPETTPEAEPPAKSRREGFEAPEAAPAPEPHAKPRRKEPESRAEEEQEPIIVL